MLQPDPVRSQSQPYSAIWEKIWQITPGGGALDPQPAALIMPNGGDVTFTPFASDTPVTFTGMTGFSVIMCRVKDVSASVGDVFGAL